MSKKIVSTTLAIGLDFIQGVSTSSSYISSNTGGGLVYSARSIFIPFLVDEIIVKSIDAHFMADIGLVNWSSSMINGGTLGIGAIGSAVDTTNCCYSNVSYKFRQPVDINGVYTFSYENLQFARRVSVAAGDKPAGTAFFVIEFISNNVEHSSRDH
jgi:hypothetical protein